MMAYEYNPYNAFTPRYFEPQQPQQKTNQGLNWVSGEIGAKAYAMAPGNTVILMDSESDTFYIKSTDMAGMPTLKAYTYKERPTRPPEAPNLNENETLAQFATKKELDEIRAKYEEIIARLESKEE